MLSRILNECMPLVHGSLLINLGDILRRGGAHTHHQPHVETLSAGLKPGLRFGKGVPEGPLMIGRERRYALDQSYEGLQALLFKSGDWVLKCVG